MKSSFMKISIGLFVAGQFILTGCAKAPSACFTLPHPSPFKVGEEIHLDASCSKDTRYYTWYFKDGTSSSPSSENEINHTYSSAGTYLLKLKAEGKNSKESVVELDVVVTD